MSQPRAGAFPWLALGLIVSAMSLSAAAQQSTSKPAPQPELPRPTFDTKAELVLVDVTVVDRDSNQVPNLTSADFDLQVNGQSRPIQSLQFVSTVATETTPATPRETQYLVERARDHGASAPVHR